MLIRKLLNKDKKAEIEIDYTLKTIIVIVSVILAIVLFMKFGLPWLVETFIPDAPDNNQNTVDNEDVDFDRCQPFDDEPYSLKKGRLEVLNNGGWVDIEDNVATDEMIFNMGLKDSLEKAIDNLVLIYDDKSYKIEFTSNGFESTFNGYTYAYWPKDNLNKKTIGELRFYEVTIPIVKEQIINSYQDSLDNAVVSNIYFWPRLFTDSFLSAREQSTINPSDINKKIFAYMKAEENEGVVYGIDYTGEIYVLEQSGQPWIISDWKQISDDKIATEIEVGVRDIKDRLIEACK
ncbi:MAG: hypothetical protein WC533_04290 [Candidatus Pacearchaeota archaeon]